MALKDSIGNLITHLSAMYFKPFLASLKNLNVTVGGDKVFIRDKVTGDYWAFPLTEVSGKNPDELRRHMRDFLLNETWDKERKSKYYGGTCEANTLN